MAAQPIRILHIVHALGYGGMESRIARLARGLPRPAHAVSVLSLKAPTTGALELPPGTAHEIFPVPPGLHPKILLGLAAAVRRGKYDVVHTHNWSSMFYGILAGRLARVPLVLHGEHGLNRDDLGGIPWKRLWAQRVLARLAHHLVPVNKVIAAHVKAHWKLADKDMTVIPNGVDLKRFAPVPRPAGEAFTLGMIGRLDDVKDIGCALGALAMLDKGVRLILVGDGPKADALAAEARTLGVADRVEFAGSRADVEAWYPRFDAYLNTSVYEGMCNTLLEGMACGLPLIASRVPGNAAWLREGENALFFPPGDANALAGRIRELRADPAGRAAMGARNRARAEAEYDNAGFLDAYAGLYARLLAGRRRVS